MKLTAKQRRLLDDLATTAKPLSGIFFRAVEFRWMHPDDVMSGAGAAKLGGRFVSVGTKALYVSDSEETLLQEIAVRKRRLGGKALIDLDKYPRVTFRIDLKLDEHITFVEGFRTKDLERIRRQCLDVENLAASQVVGSYLAGLGVQAILYPSVAGGGTNVVVFVESTRRGQVVLFNRAQVIAQLGRLRRLKDSADQGCKVRREMNTIKAGLVSTVPLKRSGRPEEIAQAVLFLASEKGSFVTGHILAADGGKTAG